MKKIITLSIILVFSLTVVHSQTIRQWMQKGKKAMESENYEAAEFYYQKAIIMNESPAVAWKLADAARLNRDYPIAEKWYLYVYDQDAKNYPLSSFWLGMVQKSLGLYQKAQLNFRRYYLANIKSNNYYTIKAHHEITSCENALFMTFDPVETPFERLDSIYNSPYSEFQISDISDTLKYISSLRPVNESDSMNYYSKIFKLHKSEQNFIKSFLDSTINIPNKNISSFAFFPNHDKIVFSACDRKLGKFKCSLYLSEMNNGQWQAPELLPDNINYPESSVTNPNFAKTPHGTYLLFASDRPEGMGKLDLWYSKLDSSGLFNDPVNFGKNLNSPDDDCTPFWDEKTQTLYYSSEWFDNLGGTDIFYVQGQLESLKYPQNLGFPLNSSNHEVYYSISENKEFAYFSSNRTLDKSQSTAGCCNDLFRINLPKPKPDSVPDVKLETKLKRQSTELIPISLFFHNDEPNPRTWDTITTLNYELTAEKYLGMRGEYQKSWSEGAKAEDKEKALAEIESFFIDSVEKNYQKLIKFTQLMEQLLAEGQEIEITIKGFASPLNSNAYNVNLSKRRTQSLVNFFREYKNGILIPYMESNDSLQTKLIIKKEAYGEEMVVKGVSDNLNDLRNSVYSPSAARERKIAVIAIAFPKKE